MHNPTQQCATQTDGANSCVLIGALAPLSPPGWVDAGKQLLAGLELAVLEVNRSGGISGKQLKLLVRDTAADAQKAVKAVDELVGMGVVALVGEYHSVVARAVAARAAAIGVPYLCSSAVIDELHVGDGSTGVNETTKTDWVARLAPAQSHGWSIYADFLLSTSHNSIVVAADPSSVYWRSGSRILRENFAPRGGSVIELDVRELTPTALCDELVRQRGDSRISALLLLVGHPEPAVSIVKAVRCDTRLEGIAIGTPAGQAEFAEWSTLLGDKGTAIPFLSYMPERLTPFGTRVEAALAEKLATSASFVAFEGYDTILVLAELLRTQGVERTDTPPSWSQLSVPGTRGQINFSRVTGINIWQWAWPPVRVVDREPGQLDRLRTRHVGTTE